jgi:anti-sigma factor RsiW
MDHETAVKMQAAERYALDEFSPEERTDFEDHYFGCTACADDVRAVSILAANAKGVIAEEEVHTAATLRSPGPATWRFSWGLVASAALNLVLLAGIGLQGLRLGPRKAPLTSMEAQFYQSFGVPAASRAEMKTLLVPAGSRFFGARFDLMPGQHFDSYEYQILDAAGTSISGQPVKAPAFNDTELQLAVPVSSLAPGEYVFVLLGRQQDKLIEISRAHLSIQR